MPKITNKTTLTKKSQITLLEENFGKVKPKKKPEDFKEIRKNFEKKVGERFFKGNGFSFNI